MEEKKLKHAKHEFGPLFDENSETLILGSFPSVKSREQAFFYGHPQNRFWRVMTSVLEEDGIEHDDIEAKKAFAHRHRLALYDVIEECDIVGSSDSSIRNVIPADLVSIIGQSKIHKVIVNGRTAEKYYKKYQESRTGIPCIQCPSTSPANAAKRENDLIRDWRPAFYGFYGWETADVKPVDASFPVRNPRDLYNLLSGVWCSDTCAPRLRETWTVENKTLGQCSITAFLAQEIFGGEVYGILRPGGNYHCYNVVGDVVFDLTSEQFGDEAKMLVYEKNPKQDRKVHFAKAEKRERYEYLKEKLMDMLLAQRNREADKRMRIQVGE